MTGNVVYTEEHNVVTNDFGLFNLNVGGGTVVLGDFSTIDWGNSTKYLEIEADFAGGTNYSAMGTSQLLSVPYALYAEKEFTYNNIKQYNRNALLWDRSLDVDGIKTGHTDEAGYSLITSATRDGMRLVSVVMGTANERARQAENKKLLTYGFRFFETITPYQAGEQFAEQRIWQGDKENIQLGILNAVQITIPRGKRKDLQADFTLNQQLIAPITKGQQVGNVYIKLDGEDIANYPLVALEDVAEGGFFSRMVDYIKMQFN